MAIEITPTQKIKTPVWTIIILLISGVALMALGASYLYLYTTSNKISKEIEEKKQALIDTPAEKALAENFLFLEKKINNFGNLLSQHQKTFNVFGFLEKICHPQVEFSDFTFNSKDGTVLIKGLAENFVVLGQQILIFKAQQGLKKINFSEISMGEKGKVTFSLQLTVDPQIFK